MWYASTGLGQVSGISVISVTWGRYQLLSISVHRGPHWKTSLVQRCLKNVLGTTHLSFLPASCHSVCRRWSHLSLLWGAAFSFQGCHVGGRRKDKRERGKTLFLHTPGSMQCPSQEEKEDRFLNQQRHLDKFFLPPHKTFGIHSIWKLSCITGVNVPNSALETRLWKCVYKWYPQRIP